MDVPHTASEHILGHGQHIHRRDVGADREEDRVAGRLPAGNNLHGIRRQPVVGQDDAGVVARPEEHRAPLERDDLALDQALEDVVADPQLAFEFEREAGEQVAEGRLESQA